MERKKQMKRPKAGLKDIQNPFKRWKSKNKRMIFVKKQYRKRTEHNSKTGVSNMKEKKIHSVLLLSEYKGRQTFNTV